MPGTGEGVVQRGGWVGKKGPKIPDTKPQKSVATSDPTGEATTKTIRIYEFTKGAVGQKSKTKVGQNKKPGGMGPFNHYFFWGGGLKKILSERRKRGELRKKRTPKERKRSGVGAAADEGPTK